ncbi:pyridoxamine 5'-phosphate oxidase family protein [Bacillus mangrovi]|uniref:Pyridoxamine 5'-phosphate oxidase family protein n=1 Tax=Metabacillus mangrovi TaxID=1491830 RepID=A0A7X2S8C5_9BACI|nr:MSMEG_1061 family FMN-dependent PPOX-type flavoprotein [Metabacillus mangrovi]MTH55494.1 pyridoxamine 5'-phosphate oxidase family protein [Metabacillus mangrovi]
MRKWTKAVTSPAELEEIWSQPGETALKKVISHLDSHCKSFLANCPFAVLGTSNSKGVSDVSPRGDQPGFILVLNDKQLIIPERPGNRRLDSIRNLLENPRASLLCVIPGLDETLRIKGKAAVIRDPDLLERMQAQGRLPLAGIAIDVEECFIHCGKAMKRSSLWKKEGWPDLPGMPLPSTMLAAHAGMAADEVKESLEESYRKRLY